MGGGGASSRGRPSKGYECVPFLVPPPRFFLSFLAPSVRLLRGFAAEPRGADDEGGKKKEAAHHPTPPPPDGERLNAAGRQRAAGADDVTECQRVRDGGRSQGRSQRRSRPPHADAWRDETSSPTWLPTRFTDVLGSSCSSSVQTGSNPE